MKKDKLGLFFLEEDEAHDFLQAEQSGEENGAAVDGESDEETDYPVEVQLLDEESDCDNGNHEQDDVEPIAATHVKLEDALGTDILQESRDGLHAEAGAGGTHGIEARDDDEVEQDIDDHASGGYEVELLEAAIGGKQCPEDVSC